MKKVHRSNRPAVLGLAAIAMLGLTACQDGPTAPDTAAQLARGGGSVKGGPVPITACGTIITEPGKYRLTTDLLGCGVNGITIHSSDVTLHLGGHTISHAGGPSGTGLAVLNVSNVSIHGPGSIENFPLGGEFAGVSDSRMSGVTVTQSRFQGFAINMDFFSLPAPTLARSTNNEFYDNRFIDNSGAGITMNGGDANKFRGNVSTGNIGTGYFMFDAHDNDFKDNVANDNVGAGFWTWFEHSTGNLIQGNSSSGNGVTTGQFDGQDDGVCDNTWISNTFGTVNNPACIS